MKKLILTLGITLSIVATTGFTVLTTPGRPPLDAEYLATFDEEIDFIMESGALSNTVRVYDRRTGAFLFEKFTQGQNQEEIVKDATREAIALNK